MSKTITREDADAIDATVFDFDGVLTDLPHRFTTGSVVRTSFVLPSSGTEESHLGNFGSKGYRMPSTSRSRLTENVESADIRP